MRALDAKQREKVLDSLIKKDPQLAQDLRKQLINFDDLKLLTPQMILELSKLVTTNLLAVSLRSADVELVNHFLNNLPKSVKTEIEEILHGSKVSARDVRDSRMKILEIVQTKVEEGQFVLNKDKNETLV